MKKKNPVIMSYEKAKAAALDAANRQMKSNRRVKWNTDDYNLACRTLTRLWPESGMKKKNPAKSIRKNPVSEKYAIVEKKHPLHIHGYCYSKEKAEEFLKNTVPEYVKRGFYTDKTLKADSFKVIKITYPKRKNPMFETLNIYKIQFKNGFVCFAEAKTKIEAEKLVRDNYEIPNAKIKKIERIEAAKKNPAIRKNPRKTMKRRKNQSPVPAWEEREAEGKRRAKTTEKAIAAKMDPDRYQASHFMRNMIRALEIGPWNNTIDDWQRYFEAKYILKLRKSRR